MPPRNREFELKLTLQPKELDRLAADSKLANSEEAPSPKHLRSVYYDTPDHRLHGKGMTLRVRHDGQRFIQTVKADTRIRGGLSNPIESETALESNQPDLDQINNKRLRRKIRKVADGSILAPAFEVLVERRAYRLHRGGSTIELALDRGEARTKNRRSEICEAELELLEGSPGDLLQAAQSLFGHREVCFSELSKAERGYELLHGRPPAARIEPAYATEPEVMRGQTCGEAFAAIFRSASEQIIKNREVVLRTEDPEGAHQLRVGLTRLRAAHAALKPLIDAELLEQQETDVKELSRAAGALRDADVLLGDIVAPVAAAASKPSFERLSDALRQYRLKRQAEARNALNSERWPRLLIGMALWPAVFETDTELMLPIEDCARKTLKRRWRDAAKYGRSIERLEPDERHAMRKALKKMRYTVEFLAPLYDKQEVKPFVKRLKKLQDVFGYLNDARLAGNLPAIAKSTAGGEPELYLAIGYVLGYHETNAAQIWRRGLKEWAQLESVPRFWR
ncbi:MAG TPA: CHAD domain-containing protein [Hyphomicrobiales bacterium]|nr:CHAD domain-containing protein [Hyphomicrobiales bacterium]